MKAYKEPGYSTYCGTLSEWVELKAKFEDSESVSVLDLRTVLEIEDSGLEELPESWSYSRMVLLGETISEQDVDLFRREQRRHGKLLVLAENEARASLLALADKARKKRSQIEKDELENLEGIELEKNLVTWLEAYLSRHQTTDRIGRT